MWTERGIKGVGRRKDGIGKWAERANFRQKGKETESQRRVFFFLFLLWEGTPLFALVVPTPSLAPLPIHFARPFHPSPRAGGSSSPLPLDSFPWLNEVSVLRHYTCLPQGQMSTGNGLPLGTTCFSTHLCRSGPGTLEATLILIVIFKFLYLDFE